MGVPEGLTISTSLDYESEGRRVESCRALFLPYRCCFPLNSSQFYSPDTVFPQQGTEVQGGGFSILGCRSWSILIMDVHPSVSMNPEGPTSAEPFAPEALYELKVDTDRDAVADIAWVIA
jgi:hypothetical protein